MLVEKEGLWCRVLKARYDKEGAIEGGGIHGSLWWRVLCNIRGGEGTRVGNWFEDYIRRVVGDAKNTFFWTNNWVGGVPLRNKFHQLFYLVVHRECSVADMTVLSWEEGGSGWVWRRGLLSWEEEFMREFCVLLHNVVLQDHVNDSWKWLLEPTQGYSVRRTYHFLTASYEVLDAGHIFNVWHEVVPSKISVFSLRLLRNRIPTKQIYCHEEFFIIMILCVWEVWLFRKRWYTFS